MYNCWGDNERKLKISIFSKLKGHNSAKQEPPSGGGNNRLFTFSKSKQEIFKQILMFSFYKFNRSVLSN
jgi:hypothetical protein